MRKLTKNMASTVFKSTDTLKNKQVKRVLICRPNHRLGNMLLITPLVQEVENTFPDCKIDLFVKGNLSAIIFKNYSSVDRIIKLPKKHFKQLATYLAGWYAIKKKHYDIVINVNKNSSSGRLSTKAAAGKYKFFGDIEEEDIAPKHADYIHIAKYPVYNFRHYLSLLGVNERKNTPVPTLNIKLTADELAKGKEVLYNIVKNNNKTISIFTHASGSKCYSEDWWTTFYTQLKEKYRNYNIIEILPVENVSQIDFKAPYFYSKDIREIAAVIANTSVFIGADSGMMHLASASQTPTVALFSGGRSTVYTPYNENSIAISTKDTCLEDWMPILDRIITIV
ncbi:glycosyltransferase family 9 protein [Flavobacterium litorale]|uniref:Glycosyltransferase family 9 protein n=2 Tax=Flavobacterium litorale TaxID=2856519 RepID=A0ABX8VE88_9FLAO|nr:glycosyltransferase family 9 protein [Flavobacterium litorale]